MTTPHNKPLNRTAPVRRASSPLRLSERERLALEHLAESLGVSLATAARLAILHEAERLGGPLMGPPTIMS